MKIVMTFDDIVYDTSYSEYLHVVGNYVKYIPYFDIFPNMTKEDIVNRKKKFLYDSFISHNSDMPVKCMKLNDLIQKEYYSKIIYNSDFITPFMDKINQTKMLISNHLEEITVLVSNDKQARFLKDRFKNIKVKPVIVDDVRGYLDRNLWDLFVTESKALPLEIIENNDVTGKSFLVLDREYNKLSDSERIIISDNKTSISFFK